MRERYQELLNELKKLESIVVAFSGGVDSTFLLYACKEALGDKVEAVTIDSPYIPRWEIEESKELVKKIGVKHKIIEIEIPEIIKDNPQDRCYLCKKEIFIRISEYRKNIDFKFVVDGSNIDDTKDYRPGMVALKELGIRSPLLENKLTKDDIRNISKIKGLETWNKPPYACLLSRIPYYTNIDIPELRRIEKAEKYLIDIGFSGMRVRSFGKMAKIEIFSYDMERFLDIKLFKKVNDKFKEYGYHVVTLDLGGYEMGNMNKEILVNDDE